MMRSFKFIILFISSIFILGVAQAKPQTTSKNTFHQAIQHIRTHAQFYVGAQVGFSRTDFGKSQAVGVYSFQPFTFTKKGESIKGPSYALDAGITIPTQDHFDYRLGVQLYKMATHKINGQVFQLPGNPADYSYRYDLDAKALFTQGQIDYDLPLGFSVFGRVGLGISEVKAHGFSATPLYRGPQAFSLSSNSSRHFAYMFGLGGGYQIPTLPISLQLGYSLYHLASTMSLGANTDVANSGGGTVKSRNVQPGEFWLALNYHFA